MNTFEITQTVTFKYYNGDSPKCLYVKDLVTGQMTNQRMKDIKCEGDRMLSVKSTVNYDVNGAGYTFEKSNVYYINDLVMKSETRLPRSGSIPLRLVIDEIMKEVDTLLTPAFKSQTISSVVGPFWSCMTNKFGTVSGQDRIHPETGLLTFGEILNFYKTPSGEFDFKNFTSLKDVATNCSLSIGRGAKSFQKPAQSGVQPPLPRGEPARQSDDVLRNLVATQSAEIEQLKKMFDVMMSAQSIQAMKINVQAAKINAQAAKIETQATEIASLQRIVGTLSLDQKRTASKNDLKAAMLALANSM